MKITLSIDIHGGLDVAREHKALIRQSVCAVLADQLTHDQETVAEPVTAGNGAEVGAISCSAVFAEVET